MMMEIDYLIHPVVVLMSQPTTPNTQLHCFLTKEVNIQQMVTQNLLSKNLFKAKMGINSEITCLGLTLPWTMVGGGSTY